MATNGSGQNLCRLFYITDHSTSFRFLVDTGAQVTTIPPTPAQRKHLQGRLHLQAVNNSTITTYGNQLLTLDLGLHRSFR